MLFAEPPGLWSQRMLRGADDEFLEKLHSCFLSISRAQEPTGEKEPRLRGLRGVGMLPEQSAAKLRCESLIFQLREMGGER